VRADRPEGRGPTGTAIREGRHVVCQDFANDPSTAPWHTIGIELGIGSVASFPIFRAGKAVGVINVDSRTPNAFDDEVVALLDEAAQDVSFALDNLDREAQRKQINEALQESETRYRSLFENMLNGFAYCKLQYDNHDRPVDFVYLSVNNAFECLTGLKNVAGKQATEAIPGIKEAHPELFEIYGRVASTGIPASFEIDFKPLRRWFSVSVYSQEKGYFVAIFDNITERKNSELAVHESEEKLRAIFEGALDGILVADMETRKFLTGNPTICRMLGYTLEEIVRIGVSDIHPEQELPRVIEQFERLLRGEIQMAADIPVMRKDSSVFYADIKAAPIRLGSKDGLLGIFRDNTERKRADDRIRRLNRIYAVLSGINSTIVRVSNREELFSEACRIAVEAGTFRAAWLGIVDRETNTVRPVAWHGLDSEYIRAMPVEQLAASDGVAPGNVGLAPLAIMERKPMIAADVTSDPRVLLRKEALERGFRSLAILPLLVEEEVVGVLALYAGEVGFFDEEEMKLLNELAGDISFALDHIAKANKLDYLVFYDQLTGLANRALFLERVNQSIHAAGRAGGEFALAILDIERLRTINESLGRQACDALIKLVAQRLRTAGGLAGVGRISADHFALVLDEVKGRSEVVRVVSDALRKCFGESFDVSGTELRLSAKAGVALYPGDGVDAETLLRNAEAALRKAKDLGERQVFYTAALTERAAGRLTLENQLRQALEKEQFVLHYQPKVDLESRAIVGVEALIRWQSPALGLVPPGKFIPLMEETGLILEVGTWALRQAALDHRKWLDLGLRAPRVAVNVSAIQLRQRDFVANVERAIMEGIAPTGIDLEITESLIMEDVQGSIEKLKAVRGLGVRIAIDDFGTGYSSLGYLAKLPVQTLKIDRSFIITMLVDPDIMTLVQTVISLAHSLQLTVVAEGVEEDEQAKMLRLLRCDQMQGYLFSKPIQFEAMTALLTQGLAQS
jgi:diguanylate cyclase (GGDEF)-like protein/PAS domain S-box-containing protein